MGLTASLNAFVRILENGDPDLMKDRNKSRQAMIKKTRTVIQKNAKHLAIAEKNNERIIKLINRNKAHASRNERMLKDWIRKRIIGERHIDRLRDVISKLESDVLTLETEEIGDDMATTSIMLGRRDRDNQEHTQNLRYKMNQMRVYTTQHRAVKGELIDTHANDGDDGDDGLNDQVERAYNMLVDEQSLDTVEMIETGLNVGLNNPE